MIYSIEFHPAHCSQPLSIPNGQFRGSGDTEGTRRNVTCKDGYELEIDSPDHVICQSNNEWSTSPVCIRKYILKLHILPFNFV